MNLVCFGSGSPMSIESAEALRRAGELSLIVIPRSSNKRNPLIRFAERHRIPVLDTSDHQAVERSMRDLAIALICCASFPEKIPVPILEASPLGGINLHPSLLPRHRGADPIFWTYVGNDRETGVTIHRMTDRIDEGEILSQVILPLDRGRSCMDLYAELSRTGARLLIDVIGQLEADEIVGRPQSGEGMSAEGSWEKAAFAVPFGEWPAERVWHVLRGLGDVYHSMLRDAGGALVQHGRATAIEAAGGGKPGTLERNGRFLRLHCSDGVVRVKTWREPGRTRRVLGRLARRFSGQR